MDYRLFIFDGSGQHVRTFVPLTAEADARAIAAAEEHQHNGSKMELWQRARLIRTWVPNETP